MSRSSIVRIFLLTTLTLGVAMPATAQRRPKPAPAAGQEKAVPFDSLIARFNRLDLTCNEALSRFREYAKGHPKDARAILYVGRAYDRMSSFLVGCSTPGPDVIRYSDSAIANYQRARTLDPQIRENTYNFTMDQMLGHAFGGRAVYDMYRHDFNAVKRDLEGGPSQGAYTQAMVDFARTTLQAADSNAILFAYGDDDTFPIWFVQFVEGYRKDVTLVNLSLMQVPWYAQMMRQGVPGWITPVAFEMPPVEHDSDFLFSMDYYSAVRASRVAGGTPDTIPVSPSVRSKIEQEIGAPVKDVMITSALRGAQAASFSPEWYDMIARILRANAFVRPVYFQQMGYLSNYNGIEPYVRLEGMVARLFPAAGAGYDQTHEEWLDTSRFVRTVSYIDQQKAMLMDPVTSLYLSGALIPELYSYARQMQTVPQIQQALDLARPVGQSNPYNAAWEYGELVLRLYERGGTRSLPDLTWMRTTLQDQLKNAPQGYLLSAHAYYARTLAALGECDALEQFQKSLSWASGAPKESPAREYYDKAMAAMCKK